MSFGESLEEMEQGLSKPRLFQDSEPGSGDGNHG